MRVDGRAGGQPGKYVSVKENTHTFMNFVNK